MFQVPGLAPRADAASALTWFHPEQTGGRTAIPIITILTFIPGKKIKTQGFVISIKIYASNHYLPHGCGSGEGG